MEEQSAWWKGLSAKERQSLATVTARDLKLARKRSGSGGCCSCTDLLSEIVGRAAGNSSVLSPLQSFGEGSSSSFRAPAAALEGTPATVVEALLVNSVEKEGLEVLEVFSRALSAGGGAGASTGSQGCCALHARPSANLLASFFSAKSRGLGDGRCVTMPAGEYIKALDGYCKTRMMCRGAGPIPAPSGPWGPPFCD